MAGGKRRGLRAVLLFAVSTLMMLTSVAPVSAAPASPVDRLGLLPEDCDLTEHLSGEFKVLHESGEALLAALKKNEVYTDGHMQYLLFDDIKDEPDQNKRWLLEEAKRKDLEKRSGVVFVDYVYPSSEYAPEDPDCNDRPEAPKLYRHLCSPEGLRAFQRGRLRPAPALRRLSVRSGVLRYVQARRVPRDLRLPRSPSGGPPRHG